MRKPFLLLSVLRICTLSANETESCSPPSCCFECCPEPIPLCCCPPESERIGARYTMGKGLGYSRAYSSLDLFLSEPFCHNRFVPFLDLRGHIFNNGRYAANAGLGFRELNECRTFMWGLNWFYDYFQSKQRPFNQVSMGFEFFTDSWSGFINGYLPVGHKETPLYQFSYLSLDPDHFLLVGTEKLALKGVDAEAGYRFCDWHCFNLYVGIGPYFYWGKSAATENAFYADHKKAFGGRFSASLTYRNWIALEGNATYDSLFKWGGQGVLSVTIPFDFFWVSKDAKGSCCLQERLYRPVRMNEIIVVDRLQKSSRDPNILDPRNPPR